jgi:DNA ligase (NAD+)
MSAGYDTLDKLLGASLNQLESVPNMGPVRAESLFNGLKHYKPVIDQLLANGATIKENKMENKEGILKGKSFVFTGALSIKRAEAEAMVIAAGGEIKSGVSPKLLYLVIADPESQSSKAVKARKLGITLLSEEQFMEMLS